MARPEAAYTKGNSRAALQQIWHVQGKKQIMHSHPCLNAARQYVNSHSVDAHWNNMEVYTSLKPDSVTLDRYCTHCTHAKSACACSLWVRQLYISDATHTCVV